jgi:cell division protease FtsH
MNDLPALPDTLATAAPALVGLLIAALLPNRDAVRRGTITPRGQSLGVTQFLPLDDRRNYPRDYLFNRMVVGLGGRAAEELACDQITDGAQSDL